MKKIVAMGLAVCMGVMSLSGCAGGSKNAAAGGEQTVAERARPGQTKAERARPGQTKAERARMGQTRPERARMGQARP